MCACIRTGLGQCRLSGHANMYRVLLRALVCQTCLASLPLSMGSYNLVVLLLLDKYEYVSDDPPAHSILHLGLHAGYDKAGSTFRSDRQIEPVAMREMQVPALLGWHVS